MIQLAYIDDHAMEVGIIRIFPNAEAFDLQVHGADQRTKTTCRFIEPTRIEIYGTPNRYVVETVKTVAGSGVEVSVKPQFIGG